MILLLVFLLLYSIVLKVFPPKKPNYLYGYQLGNAKKSIEHWRIANSYASNYMIAIYSITLALSLLFDFKQYDGGILILALSIIGLALAYFHIEKRLKTIS